MKKEPIRILNIVPNMKAAGVETFIMNIYRNIDRTKVQFDFIVHNKKREFYDDEIEKLGGKIYRFSYKDDKNIFKYIKDLKRFFKEHPEYRIVHGHMQSMMPLYLYIAKKNKVPVRVAHSHNNSYEKSLKGFILHFFSRLSKRFSNINYACSFDAGKYLFKNREFVVINNGINTDKFLFNDDSRKKIRKSLNLSNKDILIGNIGRLEKQKNQLFLLKLFNKLVKENSNYKLLIIGDGSLENELKTFCSKNCLTDNVFFLKNINNVNEYMCAMDLFCLPSLYEGLGIVLIEAQYSGLQCLTTEKTVASETNISDRINYLPLIDDIWVKSIVDLSSIKNNRKTNIKNESFDVKMISKKMQQNYIKLYKNSR